MSEGAIRCSSFAAARHRCCISLDQSVYIRHANAYLRSRPYVCVLSWSFDLSDSRINFSRWRSIDEKSKRRCESAYEEYTTPENNLETISSFVEPFTMHNTYIHRLFKRQYHCDMKYFYRDIRASMCVDACSRTLFSIWSRASVCIESSACMYIGRIVVAGCENESPITQELQFHVLLPWESI